ncbi:chromosome segregation protein sudA [Venturia nashicola]|nr:chromosome segregation protein sudA [Venturia nashicola]
MHIKQIVIQGFKSYKDQTLVDPFSPKHNVIVGRNGSGKSNFFAAIRFVLNDTYNTTSREERTALLHEGSGSAVVSAYVEIIFDNSDERFPTGKEECVIRRTIGVKKDEYSLDRKSSTKTEVMNLLESAGFSRSNPYYIVPQGRVTALTNMKDTERLNLLKEVAGTQVYEARRTESMKIMEDTDKKRERIDDLLRYINERLGELEEEKEELRAFQNKDKDFRCLQYTIQDRTKQELQRKLDLIDEQRTAGVDETDEDRELFIQREQEISDIDGQIKELKQQLEILQRERTQLDDDRKDKVKAKAKIELDVNSLTQGAAAAQKAKSKHDSELNEVQRTIKERENELAKLMPGYNEKKEQELDIGTQLEQATAAQNRLRAKENRNSTYRSKKERDDYLRKQIEDINVTLATRKAIAMQTSDEISDLTTDIGRLETEVSDMRAKLDNRGTDVQTLASDLDRAKETRDKLQDERKELWREAGKIDTILANARNELIEAERFLNNMSDRNTAWRGIKAVRRIARQHNMDGVHGSLGELFEVSDRYKTAVEVTGGASLFHFVVDNDEIATRISDILQREKAGRVTFMPLNRLKSKQVNIPKASDAVHMLDKLRFDEKFERAFQHVFGKTIICPNLQVASQYARSHSVTAITPDGDRTERKGFMTGGYHDPRNSCLDALRREAKWRTEVEDLEGRKASVERAVLAKDQEVSKAVGVVQKLTQQMAQFENGYGPLRNEIRAKTVELQGARDQLSALERKRQEIEVAERRLGEDQQAFQTEMATAFQKALSRDEEQQLNSLSSTIQDLRKEFAKLSAGRSELETQKIIIENELRESLQPRLDQLKAQELDNAGDIGGGGGSIMSSSRLKERQRELKRVSKSLEDLEKKLEEAETAVETRNSQLQELAQNKLDLQNQQQALAKSIEKRQKDMGKNMQKKAVLTVELANVNREIRELGVLPDEAFESKYTKMSSDKAIKQLHKVKEDLKKYSHVNKKAFEQYNNFTKQREMLTSRRQELDTSQESIEGLISHLDMKKDEAIERTFKQVSKEFGNVFEKLVPAGRGKLIIQRRSDRSAAAHEDDDSDDERQRSSVENYTGVGISVSFNSKHDEQQRIQQLSGGQKSLCALALVFAIQQCDPAPFYLFDEIDANLDAQYRTAVAQMIQSLSETGQFICTTFRPEMLLVAEKCYGVTFTNKTSSIDVVSTEDAMNFVDGVTKGQQ